ncbi:MAG: CNNM domain-containing protein [bacterium]
MVSLVFMLVAVFLLLLNAFFVLAEFASVKVRSTQIEVLEMQYPRQAKILRHVHDHLDEYLSVCQLGITFASIGLGFVGEPALAVFIEPFVKSLAAAHTISLTVSYIIVSFLHILIGELVPKSVAIRLPERMALMTAEPLRFFRLLFFLPLYLMNVSANLILRALRLPQTMHDIAPSEAEVRIILEKSQQEGLMPFRRLLLLENVFDFGDVRVKDEMRRLDQVVALYADHPWEENRDKIMLTVHTRYPLLEGNPPKPVGILHIKALVQGRTAWPDPVDLKAIAHKICVTTPETPLEQLLTELRRRRMHMALVQDSAGRMVGLITMEDILEQLVGAIEDEFEKDVPLRLGDVLKESRVLVDLEAATAEEAIAEIIQRGDTGDVPDSKQAIINAVRARERSLPTYLGEHLAVPHARLESIKMPVLFFARSPNGIAFDPKKPEEKARILFLLLAPGSVPRMQTKVLARIAALRESDYVWDRLLEAKTVAEALEAIRSGDELTTH